MQKKQKCVFFSEHFVLNTYVLLLKVFKSCHKNKWSWS